LVNCTPEAVLLSLNLYEYLVDNEGIAVALMLSPQFPGIFGSEFDAQ